MAIRYILFDAVGTLIYPEPSVAAAYQSAAKTQGIELSQCEIRARFAAAYQQTFGVSTDRATDESCERQLWHDVVAGVFHEWPNAVSELLDQLWRHFSMANHWPLFDDVAPAWSLLAARGYLLGIASNFDSRLRNILTGHACLAACPHVFFSTEVGYAKPDERFFIEIERRLDATPRELLMVGDDEEHDVVAPRRRGWQAIALRRSDTSSECVHSLLELARRLP